MNREKQAALDEQGIVLAGMKACLVSIAANSIDRGELIPRPKVCLLKEAYDKMLEVIGERR